MLTYLTIAVVAYLLGSIPFGYLLVRAFRGHDIRESGSGNIGATNVARAAPGLGLLTLLLDAGKGALAVLAAVVLLGYAEQGVLVQFSWEGIGHAQPAASMAALLAVAGHIFPPWLKFRGGKGVATGAGAFLLLVPKVILAALAIFVLVVVAFRYVALGSIAAVAAVPVLAYLTRASDFSPAAWGAMCATALLIVARHHGNLRRLFAGSEPRMEWRRP
jgi:glycerol-3-phosphate acyltransferase PlsY